MTDARPPGLQGPLQIDVLRLAAGGAIGMTHCPGRCTRDAAGRDWQRRLDDDVLAVRDAGYATVVTLLADDELARHGVPGLRARVQAAGLRSLQLPIADYGVPDSTVLRDWNAALPGLLAQLQQPGRVLVHCAGGFGRTGMMVATLLRALGEEAGPAMAQVRAVRPGTIETAEQEAFVRAFAPAGRG